MPEPGEQLAHYRVVEKIGAGGMGEVYRAEDGKLGRQVAIKVLPDAMASDPDRLARFEREARSLAQLNHPSIAAIYGLEQAGERRFLVLELVPGETLAERIDRGPVPVDEALAIARQIAEALGEAHAAGILHRDLKPANVKVTPDGKVKVLDFGLAKPFQPDAAGGSASQSLSPTLTFGGSTQAGVLLGTAAYMSPEQARGHAVDRRSDIWAFGVVLFELLTGQRMFAGGTVSDTLASVLKEEPQWDALPAGVPPSARRLLRRTLVRDRAARLHDIADARLEIDDALAEAAGKPAHDGPAAAAPPAADTARRGVLAVWLPWLVAVAAVVAIVALATRDTQAPPARVVRSSLLPPPGAEFYISSRQPGPATLSPDGTTVAFVAREAGGDARLWVRRLDAADATPLSGTDGASYPFWSPDSRTIGFIADGKLKRIDAAGGPALTLATAAFGKGGTWSPDGTILFAPNYNTVIHAVPASGGDVRKVTTLQPDRRENSHRFPQFLPDGRHFLYLIRLSAGSGGAEHEIAVSELDGGEARVLLRSAAQARFVSGHLLFVRERVLMAQPFDAAALSLSGDPFAVVEQVQLIPGAAYAVYSPSQEGTLIYERGSGKNTTQITWFSMKGEPLQALGEPVLSEDLRISPDGRRVAVTLVDAESGRRDIWVLDSARGGRQRITFGTESSETPVWYPDGKRLAFRTRAATNLDLFEKASDGSGEARLLLQSEADKAPTDISADGRFLLVSVATADKGYDIHVLPLDGSGKTSTFLASPTDEEEAAFSPDGHWIAYTGRETGRAEIYVTSFPDPRARFQVSRDGGEAARWSGDGKSLFFIAPDDSVMVARVTEGVEGLVTAPPEPLFPTAIPTFGNYDVFGDRLLMETEVEQRERRPLTLVQNWPALRSR